MRNHFLTAPSIPTPVQNPETEKLIFVQRNGKAAVYFNTETGTFFHFNRRARRARKAVANRNFKKTFRKKCRELMIKAYREQHS